MPTHVDAKSYALYCVTTSKSGKRLNLPFDPKCVPGTPSSECFVYIAPEVGTDVSLLLPERKLHSTYIKI